MAKKRTGEEELRFYQARLLLMLYPDLSPQEKYREVEFSFGDDDLKALRKALRDYKKYLNDTPDEDDVLEGLIAEQNYPLEEREEEAEKVTEIQQALKKDPVIFDGYIFDSIVSAVLPRLDELLETNPGLIECLADAGKVYCGVDNLKTAGYNYWLNKMAEICTTKLERESRGLMQDNLRAIGLTDDEISNLGY